MHDGDSSANWAVEAAAVSKLAKIHLKNRGKLRDELSRSWTKNIDESREKIVDEATEKISNTFKRQLDLFVQVERELVLNLNGVPTSRYEIFLPPSKPWDLELQASPTAGTIFQDSRKPLTLWFRAIWWVSSQKSGASAMGLQRILGLGSYVTAWTWLHKLRRAMVRPGRDRLRGRVEVDEAYVGGLEEGARGRQAETKALVAVACEEDGPGLGRIRLCRIDDASAASLQAFIEEAIEPGALVHTDGWEGYAGLESKGYSHRVTVLQGRKQPPSKLLPRVPIVVSLLKRWLLGTHQGAVSPEYLDYYLDEFTFRFNHRKSRSRGKLFYRLLQQAVGVEPSPYRAMVRAAGVES